MTFFQRIRTPFTESPAEEQARYQPRMRMVGDLLEERREDLGLDLDEIGAMLRIKPAYLAALEQGRARDLPGPTYAIGFVRAYADFLGLESESVLARFKEEAAGVTARPDLALPVPLGERSLPGGALVLVALILALCGYGIWYYLSTEERSRPEHVADVPRALQPPLPAPVLVAPPSPTLSGGPSDGADHGPQPSLFGAAASTTQPATAPSSPTAPPASTQPAATMSAPPVTAAPTSIVAATPLAPPASANAPAKPAAPAPPQLAPGPQFAAATPPPASASPPPKLAAQAPSQPAPAPQIAAATPPPSAAPASTAPAAGHVAIKALSDCWIQVRAPDQSIVFSRVLKSGEVYNVPARGGLSLRTGNAGALEISVDGKSAPSIGGIGALRRDVALDPAELAAGTAVHG